MVLVKPRRALLFAPLKWRKRARRNPWWRRRWERQHRWRERWGRQDWSVRRPSRRRMRWWRRRRNGTRRRWVAEDLRSAQACAVRLARRLAAVQPAIAIRRVKAKAAAVRVLAQFVAPHGWIESARVAQSRKNATAVGWANGRRRPAGRVRIDAAREAARCCHGLCVVVIHPVVDALRHRVRVDLRVACLERRRHDGLDPLGLVGPRIVDELEAPLGRRHVAPSLGVRPPDPIG